MKQEQRDSLRKYAYSLRGKPAPLLVRGERVSAIACTCNHALFLELCYIHLQLRISRIRTQHNDIITRITKTVTLLHLSAPLTKHDHELVIFHFQSLFLCLFILAFNQFHIASSTPPTQQMESTNTPGPLPSGSGSPTTCYRFAHASC